MDELILKLKTWINTIQKAIIGITVFQAIFVIIIGIASSKISNCFDIWAWILTITGLIYIFLLIVITAYQVKYPGSITEELISKRKLLEQKKFLERQKDINQYITNSIQALNEQTCSITALGVDNVFCDEPLETRLNQLLKALVDYTHIILDSPRFVNFTIGVYLGRYYKQPNNIEKIKTEISSGMTIFSDKSQVEDGGILVLKDSLNIRSDLFPKNLVDISDADNAKYEIQSSIKRSFNNSCFDKHDFSFEDTKYSIICSETPPVCVEGDSIGVLFIVSKFIKVLPPDIKEILRIFNRLISNYTNRYDQCIYDHIMSIKLKEKEGKE